MNDKKKYKEELKRLKKKQLIPSNKVEIIEQKLQDEWQSLSEVITDIQSNLKKATKLQLLIGLFFLPVFIVVIITLGVLDFYSTNISYSFLIILSAVLGYSYLLMRFQQQSSIAVERLVEKKSAILYMRITSKDIDPKELFLTGEEMFIKHNTPDAIPLSYKDYGAIGGNSSKKEEDKKNKKEDK